MKLQELLSKLHTLKDLKTAIMEIKKLQKDEAEVPKVIESPKEEAKLDPKMRLLGTDDSIPGAISFLVGIPGHSSHYKLHRHIHNAGEKPSFSVQHHHDSVMKSQSPQMHSNLAAAIKSLMHHHMHGEWEK